MPDDLDAVERYMNLRWIANIVPVWSELNISRI